MKAPPKKKPGLFDLDIPFFLPVWRRVVAAALPFGWSVVEFSTREYFWGVIFVGIGAIATWKFRTADWEAVAAREKDE